MPSNSPATFSTPSTSRPSMVRRSESSSGDQLKSTYCLSQLKVSFTSELFQKTQIVFVEQPDVVDAVTNHRDALDAEAESPTGPDLRVIADGFKNLRMDHAAPGDLQPFLANFASERAAEIDFEARLGIAKIMRAETDASLGTHELFENK